LGATYIIDRDAVFRHAFADVDPSKRAEPAAVLAALRGMKKTH
jgi:peroxiredoxin